MNAKNRHDYDHKEGNEDIGVYMTILQAPIKAFVSQTSSGECLIS